MNRITWRQLASGLLAATLSVGIAACDDDTSNGTGDMSVGDDMSAEVDMTGGGSPGIGQIVLADVVGTVFTRLPMPAPRTHALVAIASMPKVVPTSDPSSDLSLTPPRAAAHQSLHRDEPAGLGRRRGRRSPSAAGTQQVHRRQRGERQPSAGPIEVLPITCKRATTALMNYGCGFAGMANSDGGGMGMSTRHRSSSR